MSRKKNALIAVGTGMLSNLGAGATELSSGFIKVSLYYIYNIYVYTRTLQGVSNGLPHTTYRLPLGTPWRVLV